MTAKKQRARLAMAAAAVGSLVALAGQAFALNATWTGGGDSNNSGDWNTASNWTGATGGGVPTASDTAILGNVTSGTRTVTVSSAPAAIPNLVSFTQTTEGAVNRLLIESGVTFSAKGFASGANAAAGVASVVTDINGTLAITATNPAYITNMANTVNFGTGSSVNFTALSGPTITATGLVTVNAGDGTAAITSPYAGSGPSLTFKLLAGAALNVNSGQFSIMGTAANNGPHIVFDSAAGSSITIASGATLGALAASGSGNKNVNFTNGGSLNHAGTLAVRPNGSGSTTSAINNTGTWTVSGANARIEQQIGAGTVPIIGFTNSGTLTGAGMLTFSNLESAATIPVTNSGMIDPGAGGVGSLTVAGSNLAFGAGSGTLKIEAASATSHDVLAVGGTLSLTGSGDVLNLVLTDGFNPTGSFTIEDFATYTSLAGGFETILVNGAAAPAGWAPQVINNGTSADLVVAIPEPGSAALLVPALLGLRRRRNRK